MDRDIGERWGNKRGIFERMYQSIIKRFGHVERMNDGRLMERIYREEGHEFGREGEGRCKKKGLKGEWKVEGG